MAGKPAVTGLKELNRALTRMGASVEDLKRVSESAASLVAERAIQRVPVRKGRLRSSIKSRGTKTAGIVKAGRGGAVPYAGPIHFGWHARNIEPNPFLYLALDERRGEVVRKYNDAVGDLVKRLDRETPG